MNVSYGCTTIGGTRDETDRLIEPGWTIREPRRAFQSRSGYSTKGRRLVGVSVGRDRLNGGPTGEREILRRGESSTSPRGVDATVFLARAAYSASRRVNMPRIRLPQHAPLAAATVKSSTIIAA